MIEEVKLWIQFIRHPEEFDYGCIPTVADQERLCEAYLAVLDENEGLTARKIQLLEEIIALRSENECMKEVVEAARKWDKFYVTGGVSHESILLQEALHRFDEG